ncbi:60S ribosomal protein L7 [Anaeramoeba ignava]|uniref:60S ribosomal protein L7 n=1 Tax=Anaeramoeba ignava TaxID=1746090 RepID=A0A9Q0LXU0_ANAIG|nr:60S ribosomal protein L7 [Anaeramoeba ignava]|eukprot:Anaeramoba_ignava/a478221_29.p1 GENE.a478221_29~~a478221_29.p1  ORF type:complete len:259 (-),score=73.97 a478221_29:61-837(-)
MEKQTQKPKKSSRKKPNKNTVFFLRRKSFSQVQESKENRRSQRMRNRRLTRQKIFRSIKPDYLINQEERKRLSILKMEHKAKSIDPKKMEKEAENSKLIFAILVKENKDLGEKVKEILTLFRLNKLYEGVFLRSTPTTLSLLELIRPYIIWGYPSYKNIRDLIFKRGYTIVDSERTALTSNKIISDKLGTFDIICLEDLVHEIFSVGPHFNQANKFLLPFRLSSPSPKMKIISRVLKETENLNGYQKEKINEILLKMN